MNTFWMGVPVWKTPFDLWTYQELMYDLRPDVVIETGTAFGGSALFLASVCDLLGKGSVISVDLRPRNPRPVHPRIRYLEGSSTDPAMFAQVREAAAGAENALVLLDSDHSCAHVLDELRLYSSLVPSGSYVVVEDTDVNGHPVVAEFGPGPMEAVDRFLAERAPFVIDRSKEKFHMTMNPRGFLKRL
ncbi:MAG: cephalosporin hydroxylase family protein [Actinomycetota bacterium]|nr:cephalosporin hydroxylase family protein [Actinomycetota bacterium]